MEPCRVDMTPFGQWLTGDQFDQWASQMRLSISQSRVPEIVWIDLETTGLDSISDPILESGIILTDSLGQVIRDGVAKWLVFEYGDWHFTHKLHTLPSNVFEMHTNSGLLHEMSQIMLSSRAKEVTASRVQKSMLSWLEYHCGPRNNDMSEKLPMSGASVHFDRAHLKAQMPELEAWFHYRNGIDVSQFRYAMSMLNPDVARNVPAQTKLHRPVADLVDSIRLYEYMTYEFLCVDLGLPKGVVAHA